MMQLMAIASGNGSHAVKGVTPAVCLTAGTVPGPS